MKSRSFFVATFKRTGLALFLASFFLLCLLCNSCQEKSVLIPEVDGALFEKIPSSKTQILFSNSLQETRKQNILTYEYFYNGGGVAVGDINNDGLPDVFLTGNQVEDRLYLNDGDFKFRDITENAFPVLDNGWSTGVTMADVNADGWLDIYVSKSGKFRPTKRENQLFINNGDLTFTESARDYGLADRGFGTQALFFDFDLDNDLDVFVLNHNIILYPGADPLTIQSKTDLFAGDKLYRNDNGKFIDISLEAGIKGNPIGYGLGVAAGDINKDGYPDLYVTNDYEEQDYMYLNNGDGTFTDEVKDRTKHISNFGMGVDIADVNNDSWPDVFVADMVAEDNYRQKTNMRAMAPAKFYKLVADGFHHQYMFNTLQLNNGNGQFSEVAQLAGISQSDWSWSSLFMDFDNDSDRDLFITNGYRKEIANKDFVAFMDRYIDSVKTGSLEDRLKAFDALLEKVPSVKLENYIFENAGNLDYQKREDWGIDQPSFSNGAAIADLDGDGDLDLVVNNIDEEAFVYRNSAREKNLGNYLAIKLKGPAGNTSGIGTKIELNANGKKGYHEHYLTRGYQSSMQDLVHFGLGEAFKVDEIEVVWPDGSTQTLQNVNVNQTLTVSYDESTPSKYAGEGINENTLFEDITEKIGLKFNHRENKHNDFEKETLLPHKMSQFGPSLSVGDINGDGLEDFYVGGALGFSGTLFLQNRAGEFTEKVTAVFKKDKEFEDVGSAFFDVDSDGDLDLYVSSGGNELEEDSPRFQDRLYLNDGRGGFTRGVLPEIRSSGSVVKPYDFDGDGDLDLFVGGRLVPKKYPTPASSILLQNNNGQLVDITADMVPGLKKIGLVTDAEWSDINHNGFPDLIITGEWMPIKVFEFKEGNFVDLTESMGLERQTGWWFSIAASDINGDGLDDLVAGNLGLNYKYKTSPEEPFQVYYHDFDNNGSGDIVLGYFNEGTLFPLRGRQCSSDQMPFIKEKFKTYDDFGLASLNQVYGEENLKGAIHYTAHTFASTAFLNSKEGFQPVKLPVEAQFSSINSTLIEDFDGDGIKDLLIAGNLYPVEIETTRNDASYGLLLKGKGDGGFEPWLAPKSGFLADGDVKHLRVIQLAGGKKGVLVARNDGPISLFQVDSQLIAYGK